MKIKKGIAKDFSMMAVLLIPVAIAINIVGFQITQLLRLPIYLDTIGTIMVAMICGPWVGAVAGLLTNLINAIFNPVYLPFTFVSIAIGITTGYLSKKGMFLKLWKSIVSGIILTVVTTVIAAPITVLAFGGGTGHTTSAITATLLAAGQNIWKAVITSTIVGDSVDKIISAIIAYGIVKSMSSRYLSKLSYGEIYIKK
ncbi:protein of unknown function DUF3816 [Gottschalkia purinilytica]|uniref:ECF transporter S component n=1 Tax=Gottschalkia purinilytica TaxID=1503 RepID=A0A0L0WE38_GOTPU|nr:ECF transporter S component [Gottschalkia purinilytica]KNF09743.1 protein of unknown function DUF3816 [Gottschalkia purinilytica]